MALEGPFKQAKKTPYLDADISLLIPLISNIIRGKALIRAQHLLQLESSTAESKVAKYS